ncbi:GNAT family N-acetyltransferase [Halorarius halobius]|uniref:GNAT family N-acetyltransferase n=1 Tax=Halorarius halobius TaxID=2962671 RepID=UPI0020CCA489|nr:GNAT family N-acetyltransferase [Halorarius halobius]
MEVREADADDIEPIRAVATAAWHAAYDDILGETTVAERTDEWYAPELLREYLGDGDVSVFVAGDPVVGYAICRRGDDSLHLAAIYVDPDRWGEGVGSRLLDRVEREGRASGTDRVDLVVLAENDVGRGFYEARGYEQVGERDDTVDDARELVYEKPLA